MPRPHFEGAAGGAEVGDRVSEQARRTNRAAPRAIHPERLVFVAALLLLALPGPPGAPGRPDGLPWSGLELAAALTLALLAVAAWPPRRDPWLAGLALLFAALAVAKLALGLATPSVGALAAYRGELGDERPIARSTEYGWRDATRLDQTLVFAPSDFRLDFFNDSQRYNCYRRGANNRTRANDCQLDREALPFSVAWSGYVFLAEPRDTRFWLESAGPARLLLDDAELLRVRPLAGAAADRAPAALAAGWHHVVLEYRADEPQQREVALTWDAPGQRAPLAAPALLPWPVAAWRLGLLAWAPWLAAGIELLAALGGLLLAFRVGRALRERLGRAYDRRTALTLLERPLLALLLALGLLQGFARLRGSEGRTLLLPGGEDPLAYETFARDIILNGPLMTLGRQLGRGDAFHFQPFYPYWLALLHLLGGEGLFGPLVLQWFLLGVVGVLVYLLTRRLFGAVAALGALALYQVLRLVELNGLADVLLTENLYVLLVPLALLLLVTYQQRGREAPGTLAGAALVYGCAAITRATFFMALPFGLLGTLLARRRVVGTPVALGACLAFLVLVLVPMALVPLRNQVVAGKPIWFATNAGVTMQMAHTPTKQVNLKGLSENPLYDRLNLDPGVRKMLEFMRQDPAGYLRASRPLALYSLGFAHALNRRDDTHWLLVALVGLYLGGTLLDRRAQGATALAVHGFVLTHFLALVVFLPNAYGYRQVLPMDLLMLPFAPLAPLALMRAGRRLWAARAARQTPRPSLSVGRGG